MVPVWLQTPVGASEGWWDFEPGGGGGVAERNMEPLFHPMRQTALAIV